MQLTILLFLACVHKFTAWLQKKPMPPTAPITPYEGITARKIPPTN